MPRRYVLPGIFRPAGHLAQLCRRRRRKRRRRRRRRRRRSDTALLDCYGWIKCLCR
jgi:hypothetical protein